MAYRNKIFVSFDGDNDIHYYYLMRAWHQNDRSTFRFFDAHDLNTARDTSLEQSIKRQLRIRLASARVFVILIGESTRYLYRFVKWEIEQALTLGLPILAVNLNGLRYRDDEKCPPVLRDKLAVHIGYGPRIMQFALEHWPAEARELEKRGAVGPRYYSDQVYVKVAIR